jgi:hypothetical protein
VGSAEAQRLAAERLFRLPARLDLAPDELPEWAQGVMAEMIPAELDRELVAERAGEWMRRWDREVRGRGAP